MVSGGRPTSCTHATLRDVRAQPFRGLRTTPPLLKIVPPASPPLTRVCLLRDIRWHDAAGVQRVQYKFSNADLPPAAAQKGFAVGRGLHSRQSTAPRRGILV